jgi:hypothetical protein
MENKDTEYIDGDADDFTIFLFSEKPKDKNTIKLELTPSKKPMIFTSGMKYLFSEEDKLDITKLDLNDIQLMNQYFESMGFQVNVEIFTIIEYLDNMKLPNYFLNHELMDDSTMLDDFYYETSLNGNIYRVYFNYLRV